MFEHPVNQKRRREIITISHAVHHGDDHRSNNSYAKRISTRRPIDNHLFRSLRGQFQRGVIRCRIQPRTSMNGHAKQKKLPAHSSTTTRAPRKCTQLSVVARFLGASAGPNNPSRIIATLTISSGICRKVRAWRHRNKRPIPGARNKSKDSE